MAEKALTEYWKKRDFSKTEEPSGKEKGKRNKAPSGKPIFVIQKHDASRLHYDFRLEIGGVLKSWAVPKGPSIDPGEKRLAMPTEDHPMAYADFEGVIPAGEYGGGAVIIWDRGTYHNLREGTGKDAASLEESYAEGKLEFRLEGEKLRGGFALIRTGKGKDERWLLFKLKDDQADPEADQDFLERENRSVESGKTVEEIGGKSPQSRDRDRRAKGEKKKSQGKSAAKKRKPSVASSDADSGDSSDGKTRRIRVGRYSVDISHEEKILFPKSGITKKELVDYYREVAPHLVLHARNRPVTMHRFPNGTRGEGFFQKDRPDYFPDWIESCRVEKEGGTVDMVMINNAATLIYLANQVVIPHIWLTQSDRLHYPDKVIFDLDPSGRSFRRVVEGAFRLREFLEAECGLIAWPMLTGSTGIHVVIPLQREREFDEVRSFARRVSNILAENDPKRFTTEMRKKDRGNRIFLDYLRNAYAQTAVCPYAARILENAPVATPVGWDELEEMESSQAYNIRTVLPRLRERGDLWKKIAAKPQSLNEVIGRL